jgi:thiol-disulfide isomerase/thioredoxin
MQHFITALKAENIKKKGTGIFLLSMILGAISPIIWALVMLFQDEQKDGGLSYNYFTRYLEGCLDPYAGFFFPLLIIITVSRFAQLDHKNGGWQLMETQPVNKFSIYFAKFTMILVANLISILSLVLFSFLCGWIVSIIIEVPREALFSFEYGAVSNIILRLFVGGLMLSAFQYVIAVLVPSFIWSIVIGFFGLLLNIFLAAFKVVPAWSPFEILSKVSLYKEGSDLGYWLTYSETVGVIGMVLLLYIGYKWYMHKKFTWAFFSKPLRFAKLLGVVVVCVGLLAYVLQPNKMLNYSETVVSGKIDSDIKYRNLYVIDNFVNDTIAVIPITNNTFNYTIKDKIVLNSYILMFNQSIEQAAIFGDKDSIYIDLKTSKNDVSLKVTGTRLAENQYKGQAAASWSVIDYYLQDNIFMDMPEQFTKALVGEWKDAMKESDKFRTADNYVPKDDYLEKNKMLLTIKYLNYWNEYLKKRAAMFPGKETMETADIKEMKKTVPLNDESLLAQGAYFDYLKTTMTAGNDEDIDENTKSLQAITRLKPGTFKDKMLYWQLTKSLKEASTSGERSALVNSYTNAFSNNKYASLIMLSNKTIESLTKGMPAPLFDATTINRQPVSLESFKGKYVVIDVWATWCQPCKIQSPFFEKFALKYKKYPVQFIAASTDDRVDDWFVEAKTKSKSVLQVHINDKRAFSKNYDVQSIPRFILIDPQGNFVNAAMPFPQDVQFEKVLREALGLAEQK